MHAVRADSDTPGGTEMQEIFREYDIRGVVGRDLTSNRMHEIGRAIGTAANERGENEVAVARDGRLSGPTLAAAVKAGIQSTGIGVIDLGAVPTPLLYYATQVLETRTGVMVTASHNPPQYNGLKVVLDGEALFGDGIRDLYRRMQQGCTPGQQGAHRDMDLSGEYIERIAGSVELARPLRVVVDCGNGIAGNLAPDLLRRLGCDVTELYCEVDGHFPNHHPDPGRPENLASLQNAVLAHAADLGLAFDGDGDRLGLVTEAAEIVWPDRVLMMFARDVLRRRPGAGVVYDVKCTNRLEPLVRDLGGRPLIWKSGHSLIKARMRETGALLGGEMSGHFVLADEWFRFDDAFYAAARLLEIFCRDERPVSVQVAEFPSGLTTPELRVEMAEGESTVFMDRLRERANFDAARLITVDGLRVERTHGWGLVRASNTSPGLVLRFEADDVHSMEEIQALFRRELLATDSRISLPF